MSSLTVMPVLIWGTAIIAVYAAVRLTALSMEADRRSVALLYGLGAALVVCLVAVMLSDLRMMAG